MSRIAQLSENDVAGARAAARKVVETHERIVSHLRSGVTVAQVDAEIARILQALECTSCFLGYKVPRTPAFPSHACLSVNDCIVHGTAATHARPLEPGDLLSIDVGVKHRGWIGDAAWTYAIEHATDDAQRLMQAGKDALRRGIERIAPGRPYLDWAREVQQVVEQDAGLRCIRGLGGHGYGRRLHAPPFIANVVPTFAGEWPEAFSTWEPGILVALEPMLAAGTGQTRQARGTWPIYTADGSLSVHYEADVIVTEDGHENLTAGMWDLPDVVG